MEEGKQENQEIEEIEEVEIVFGDVEPELLNNTSKQYFGEKRCHFSFPVFLKKPVSVHNLRNNNGYVANTILFGYSKHRGTLLCRFSRISHAGS